LIKDGDVTPDGFGVNTIQPFFTPYQAGTPSRSGCRRKPCRPSATV
jgi:hypothetical protein